IGTPVSGIAPTALGADLKNISLVLASSHTGTLTLTSTGNTYTGPTVVHGGTLLINGNNSSTTAAATIDTGGQFGGSGTFAGPVTAGNATTAAKLLPGGAGTIGT